MFGVLCSPSCCLQERTIVLCATVFVMTPTYPRAACLTWWWVCRQAKAPPDASLPPASPKRPRAQPKKASLAAQPAELAHSPPGVSAAEPASLAEAHQSAPAAAGSTGAEGAAPHATPIEAQNIAVPLTGAAIAAESAHAPVQHPPEERSQASSHAQAASTVQAHIPAANVPRIEEEEDDYDDL